MKTVKVLIQIIAIWLPLFLWNSNADSWSNWDIFFAVALGLSVAGGAEVIYRLKGDKQDCYLGGQCRNNCGNTCTRKVK